MNTNLVENNSRIGGTMNHRMNSQSDREKGISQQVGHPLLAHGSNFAETHGSNMADCFCSTGESTGTTEGLGTYSGKNTAILLRATTVPRATRSFILVRSPMAG